MREAFEKAGDLAVGAIRGDLDGSAVIAQEGDIRGGEDRTIGESGDRERDTAALAYAGNGEALFIHLVAMGEQFQSAKSIGVNVAVIVGARIANALGHPAGAVAFGIGGGVLRLAVLAAAI